ncbi:MAG: hypothetical protein QMD04_12695 [Anaerolineales bacterium]|nr:hypothetical protein [Anaerolineales bacterium]
MPEKKLTARIRKAAPERRREQSYKRRDAEQYPHLSARQPQGLVIQSDEWHNSRESGKV